MRNFWLLLGVLTCALAVPPTVSAQKGSTSEALDEGGAVISVRHWSHVIVRVSDLDATLRFWQFLGFEQLSDTVVEGAGLEETVGQVGAKARIVVGLVGGQKVEFVQFDGLPLDPAPDRNSLGLSGLSIRINGIDAAYASAKEHGLRIEGEPTEIHGFRQFFVVDPNGVRIELSQPPPGIEVSGPLSQSFPNGPDEHAVSRGMPR